MSVVGTAVPIFRIAQCAVLFKGKQNRMPVQPVKFRCAGLAGHRIFVAFQKHRFVFQFGPPKPQDLFFAGRIVAAKQMLEILIINHPAAFITPFSAYKYL